MNTVMTKAVTTKKIALQALLTGSITLALLWLLYYLKGYAPFGELSLATMDGNIQYLDFFAYFKDVLAGENHIGYTFSKALGGNNIGTFSYYLSSPFNLLLFCFKKENLVVFFDLVVSLKLAVAAASCFLFLTIRIPTQRDPLLARSLLVMLAISYALCQYSIAQASNIMWLDGVYMLPLILLGVYQSFGGGAADCSRCQSPAACCLTGTPAALTVFLPVFGLSMN